MNLFSLGLFINIIYLLFCLQAMGLNVKAFHISFMILLITAFPISIARSATCQDVMIPLYVYPDTWNPSGAWNRAINAPLPKGRMRYLIINPNSGPGSAPGTPQHSDYAAAIEQIRAEKNPGLQVCGYVRTNYGGQPLATVQAELSKYYDWYNVDCIFLDEASTKPEKIQYYQSIVSAHNDVVEGSDVIFNHGYWPDQGYMNISSSGDSELIHVVTENSYNSYISDPGLTTVPQWILDWPEESNWRFVHLIHSTPDMESMLNVLQTSTKRNAGGIYITDDILNNPWDWSNGEPYWEALATETALGCN